VTTLWPMVALADVLTKSDNWIAIQPDTRYRQITVRLWGKGVVQRGEITA
jgi:type I restriction enzyme S subunit